MDKNIRRQFNRDIFGRMLSFWNLSPEDTEELDGFESFIYKTVHNGRKAVLKISHSQRRTLEELEGEIDFTGYLFDRGIDVPEIIADQRGNLINTVPSESGFFTGVLYSYLDGRKISEEDRISDFPERMGRFTGRLHKLSRDYAPRKGRRADIFDEFSPAFDGNLDSGDNLVRVRVDELFETFKSIPRNRDNWGMIHVNIHGGNFHIDEGRIALFDFDDCQYSWFVHDIAMAFFYTLPHRCDSEEDVEKGYEFLNMFLRGYKEETELPAEELARIPLFLKLRELELYALIKRSFDPDDLDPWCESFMKGRKERLEKDIPFFPFDSHRLEL